MTGGTCSISGVCTRLVHTFLVVVFLACEKRIYIKKELLRKIRDRERHITNI